MVLGKYGLIHCKIFSLGEKINLAVPYCSFLKSAKNGFSSSPTAKIVVPPKLSF